MHCQASMAQLVGIGNKSQSNDRLGINNKSGGVQPPLLLFILFYGNSYMAFVLPASHWRSSSLSIGASLSYTIWW